MSDAYVECLVKAKASALGKVGRFLLTALCVLCVLAMFVLQGMMLVGLAGAVITGLGAYFVNLYTDLEYEYLYLDKELTVDKVMAKTKRKRIAVYSLSNVEILAPIKSYRLDNYKNRNVKVTDYSVGEELQPDRRYVMYYEGGQKVILSPSEELIKIMKNASPRKVFSD